MDSAYKVSGEADAWCGPCKRVSVHVVIAMVDGLPRQVMCLSCKSRHNYRVEPVRTADRVGGGGGEPITRKLTPQEHQARKKQDELAALGRELAVATNVKPFARRGVFRAGDVIEHPDYGRGKVENARRETIMVRFSTGLKSLLIS